MHQPETASDPELHRELWVSIAPLLNVWFNDFRKANPEEAPDVEALLTKRENEPGMEPFLLDEMKDHGPTEKRRREMIHAIVSSLIKGTFKPKTHAKNGGKMPRAQVRTRQRFYNEEFRNLFPEIPSLKGRETIRTSIVAPAFAGQSVRLRTMGEKALRTVSVQGTLEEPLPNEVKNRTRMCNPVFIQDFARFQQQALQSAQSVVGKGKEPDTPRSRELLSNLRTVSDVLVMLHANVTGILAAEWFRSRRPEKKREILSTTHKVVMTREAADAAFKLLVELYGSEEAAGGTFELAACPFVKEGSWEFGFLLFERAYVSPVVNDHVRGAFAGNMGYMLKRGGHLDEAIFCFRRSIWHHAQAKDGFDLVIAVRDLAEALWPSKRAEAIEWINGALKLASMLEGMDKDEALYNFVTMFERLGEPAYREWAKNVRAKGKVERDERLPGLAESRAS